MSDAEVEGKFRPLAAKVLTAAQTDRLLATLWKLEEVSDVADLLRLTVANKS
jgi:hypothetical protein